MTIFIVHLVFIK